MSVTCAAPRCSNPSDGGWCSARCHDVWVDNPPLGRGPVALSWLGETRKPPVNLHRAVDGTPKCCRMAILCHPWPCPWHVPWGGWPRPEGAVNPDVYQYAETKAVAS